MVEPETENHAIRFGLLLSGQHLIGADVTTHLDEHLEQTRLAGEQGFAGVFYSEHFLTPTLVRPHQMVFLARVAAEAGKMQVGTALTLLPLKNPVELADMAATLDHITHGRFILGLGLGYREIEYKAFGLTRAMAPAIFDERLAVLKRLWSEEEITYQGHGFTLEKATCTLRPVQRPHPPIWIGANTEGAIRRAAMHGDAWLINGTPDDVIRDLETCIEQLGVNYIIVRMQWPGMAHRATARAIKLMGKYVIPSL